MQAGAAAVADRASRVIVRYARLGAALAGGVALIGLVIAGATFLVGRAALDGTAESVWTVFGVMLLAGAVVPPVIAALSLRRVGRSAAQLVSELRSLFDSGGEASTVVIETTEVTVDGSRAVVATAMPTMGRLRYAGGAVRHVTRADRGADGVAAAAAAARRRRRRDVDQRRRRLRPVPRSGSF